MAISLFGPLIFSLFPLAGSANDLVSLIDAADYFQSRQIDAKADRLVELAGKKADGSADRVAQLLAIRWLSENPDELKKTKNGRETLQQLADGKLGQDPQGFVKDYAVRALARLDGKKPVLAVIGDGSLKESLAWFPDGVSFCYAIDVRTRLKEALLDEASILPTLRRLMGLREKQMLCNIADTIGNIRVDGMAIGMTTDPNQQPDGIYVRVTGRGDRDLLAKYLFVQNPNASRVEEKGPNGEPITLLQIGEREPAMALVGSTDFILAGRSRPQKDSLEFVRDVLAVRAGKKASAVKGSLANVLKEAPAGASVLLGGRIPGEITRMLEQPRGPLPPLPKDGLFSVVADKTIELKLTGKLASAEEAKGLADSVAALKQQGLAALKAPGLPLKADAIAVFQKALESIKAEVNGDQVQISSQLTADTVKALAVVIQDLIPKQPLPEE